MESVHVSFEGCELEISSGGWVYFGKENGTNNGHGDSSLEPVCVEWDKLSPDQVAGLVWYEERVRALMADFKREVGLIKGLRCLQDDYGAPSAIKGGQ